MPLNDSYVSEVLRNIGYISSESMFHLVPAFNFIKNVVDLLCKLGFKVDPYYVPSHPLRFEIDATEVLM